MITLKTGTYGQMFFTATPHCLLEAPYFLFVFTHRGTQDVVKLIGTNTSAYTARYDKVLFVVNDYFDDKDRGLWGYEVYEQANNTNDDPTGLNLVETGLMLLSGPETETLAYDANIEVKTYGT